MKDDERFEISNLIWLLGNELKPLFLCVAWAKIIDFIKLEDLLKDIATKDWLMWKQRITLIMLISLFEEQILYVRERDMKLKIAACQKRIICVVCKLYELYQLSYYLM